MQCCIGGNTFGNFAGMHPPRPTVPPEPWKFEFPDNNVAPKVQILEKAMVKENPQKTKGRITEPENKELKTNATKDPTVMIGIRPHVRFLRRERARKVKIAFFCMFDQTSFTSDYL